MSYSDWIAIIVALLGVVVAAIESRGKRRMGRTLRAVIRGAERGSKSAGTREIKRAICEEALRAGVEEWLRPEVAAETGEPTTSQPERDR